MADTTGREPHLTARQREILERIAKGRTNVEIADELGIGFETVKMHVSHLFAELGVSSREEAAAWWRASRRPVARLRALVLTPSLAKIATVAGAVVAVAAVGVVALFAAGSRGSTVVPALSTSRVDTPPATNTAAPPSPTATPQPVGYQAAAAKLHFQLVEFDSDALHTEVTIDTFGPTDQFRETGYPLVWVTDATGQRHLLQSNRAVGTRSTFTGGTIANTPGTVTIEVTPVRDYVVPTLTADQPTPAWAAFTVSSGYTDDLVTVQLPNPNRRPLDSGDVIIDQVLKAGDEIRVLMHSEGYSGSQPFGLYVHALLFDERGELIAQGGAGAPNGGPVPIAFLGVASPGRKTLLVRIDDALFCLHAPGVTPVPAASNGVSYPCPPPTASPTPEPQTLGQYQKLPGSAAVFELDVP